MDHGSPVNARVRKGMAAFLLLALLLVPAGCHRGWHGGTTPPPGPEEPARDNTTPATVTGWLPPVVKADIEERTAGSSPTDNAATGNAATVNAATDNVATDDAAVDNTAIGAPAAGPPAVTLPPQAVPSAGSASPESAPPSVSPIPKAVDTGDGQGRPSAGEGRDATRRIDDGQGGPSVGAGRDATGFEAPTGQGRPSAGEGRDAPDSVASTRKPKPAAVPLPAPVSPPKDARGAALPGWARSPEELVYRVDFIGITMGYARFRYSGKVSIAGKTAYHLNVRAWTSGVLSYIYPINETIDYYLDAETIAPIRQEFTQREREKDDVAYYNQETGKITYRYRQSGKIRKEVDTIPSVYDPVSVAYYFRWKDLGLENRPRNMYGGRKVYQISSRILGNERIRTPNGEVDTIAVMPLIRRNGKPDNKGDLKVWFSNDDRRVPVRLYAKFHKIKDWTLVGELMPSNAKAGG